MNLENVLDVDCFMKEVKSLNEEYGNNVQEYTYNLLMNNVNEKDWHIEMKKYWKMIRLF